MPFYSLAVIPINARLLSLPDGLLCIFFFFLRNAIRSYLMVCHLFSSFVILRLLHILLNFHKSVCKGPWVGIYFCLKSPSLACAGRAHSIAFCQVLPRGPPLTPADFSPPLLPPLKWKAVSPLAWSAVIPSNWVLLVRAASPVSLRNELSFNLFFWII